MAVLVFALAMGNIPARVYGTAIEYKAVISGAGPPCAMAHQESLALVLEDTDLGRWALTHALEAHGYQVHAPWTWAEASAWLVREKFAIALVAVSSPSHAVEVMADGSWHPYTHLVLLADEDIIDELRLACGPGPDIMAKPLDLDTVAQIARSCLEKDKERRRA